MVPRADTDTSSKQPKQDPVSAPHRQTRALALKRGQQANAVPTSSEDVPRAGRVTRKLKNSADIPRRQSQRLAGRRIERPQAVERSSEDVLEAADVSTENPPEARRLTGGQDDPTMLLAMFLHQEAMSRGAGAVLEFSRWALQARIPFVHHFPALPDD